MTPIFKTETKTAQNYTGISLLKTCYKIFSKMLCAKLKLHSENSLMEPQCEL
jgi:hypothetical protein